MDELQPTRPVVDPLALYRAVDRSRPQGECWVMGHMVAGFDGTAAINGRVGALSTAPDQRLFRRMRELGDVILVGAQTVRLEGYGAITLDAEAAARRVTQGKPATPPVAIVSGSLRLDFSAAVFADAPEQSRTLILTCAAADPNLLAEARQVAEVVIAGDARVEPRLAVAALADLGHGVVICEGGPTWLGELAAADRLDELCLSVAPLIGGDPLPVAITPAGTGISRFALQQALVEDSTLFLRHEAVGAS